MTVARVFPAMLDVSTFREQLRFTFAVNSPLFGVVWELELMTVEL
jgi:hypothetical protein